MRLNRLGSFFIFIGILALFLFLISDISRMADFRFLFGGIAFIVLGSLIKWMQPKPEKQPSTRFRMFRKQDDDE